MADAFAAFRRGTRSARDYAALRSRGGSSQRNARHRPIDRLPARGNLFGRSDVTRSKNATSRPMDGRRGQSPSETGGQSLSGDQRGTRHSGGRMPKA